MGATDRIRLDLLVFAYAAMLYKIIYMKKSISFGVSLTQKVIFNDDVYLIAFKEESQIANISVICEELPKNQLLEIDLNVSVDDTIQSLLDLENNE